MENGVEFCRDEVHILIRRVDLVRVDHAKVALRVLEHLRKLPHLLFKAHQSHQLVAGFRVKSL